MPRRSLPGGRHPRKDDSVALLETAATRVLAARALLLTVFVLLTLGAAAPPLIEAGGDSARARTVRLLYGAVCHQRPERSFWIGEASLAVCQRCSGIYAGLLLGAAVPASGLTWLCGARRRSWALAGLAPAAADVALGAGGLWAGSPVTRCGSGLVLGIVLATLALAGLAEAVAEFPRLSGLCVPPSTARRSTR
jgi:uncharacterized membrane protein